MAADPIVERFDAPASELFAAVQRAAQESAKTIEGVDEQARTIYFNTGLSWSSWNGQNVTATVAEDASGGSTVTVGVQIARRGLSSFQLISWGEGGRVAKKLIARTREQLGASAAGV